MKKLFWFLGLLISFLFFSSVIFLMVINIKEPSLLDPVALFLFYISLTLAFGSFFALIKVLFLKLFFKETLQSFHFKVALRQGVLLGVLLSLSLFLQKEGKLNIISGAIMILGAVAFEFLFNKKSL
jgi:hypothetical protein